MIKFKTFFRKHGASGSGSAAKNKGLGERVKENHFESAVAAPPSTALTSEFEKPAVTCSVVAPSAPPRIVIAKDDEYCSHESLKSTENSSFSKMSDSSDMGMEYENLKREFDSVLDEKSNLELTLQELVKSHGELDTVKKEIEELKSQRNDLQNSILLRLSKVDNLAATADPAEKNARNKKLPNSAPASIAPPTESTEMLDTQDWDKRSSSSLSEVSVACLQDRIMQMEETHYSTSEELQATLQELVDLQAQLSELQNDNERLGEEKGVLLESLCRQTEKLEDARTKVDTLQDLLLDTNKTENSFSEREQKLMLLLRDGQQDREVLLLKQKEHMTELEELKRSLDRQRQESNALKERVHLLESTVDAANAERKQFEHELSLAKEENSCKCIEIKRLETLLENARSKIEKMEEARDMESDKNDIDDLIDTLRKEKDHLEMKVASLQEQLSKSMCEIVKLKEQLLHAQEECRVARNNAKSAVNDLEYKCQKYIEEAEQTANELRGLRENYLELEVQCQCHLDDKKQLKGVLLETQQHLAECERAQEELKQTLEDEKKLRVEEQSEWEQFQNDLLMTVRVANDLKTEAQGELQRLVLENKQLRDKIKLLETKIQTLTKVDNTSTPLLHRTLSNNETSSYFNLSQEMNRRPKSSKLLRQDSRLSVKSLIESIENAAKQAKTGNVCIRSHSASSLSLTNQLSGSSSPSSDIAVSSLGQLKDSYDLHISKKNCEEHLSPNNSLILANTKGLEFARKTSANDLSEKKDPLQALVKNGGSKRNALLKWCQNKVAGYANVDITNFSSSWNDGMALCALLHSYLPDKVPYDTLNPADKKRNFTIAFEAAESVGIKTSLNIIDMIQEERPDWNQVMAYVTTIFRHFES